MCFDKLYCLHHPSSSLTSQLCRLSEHSSEVLPIQRLIKRLLLNPDRLLHLRFARADFGEHIAHRLREHVHEFVEERFVEAERAPIPHRAAQDAAQHVVAVGVAGLDAVGNGKAQRADVVGNDAERDVDGFLFL